LSLSAPFSSGRRPPGTLSPPPVAEEAKAAIRRQWGSDLRDQAPQLERGDDGRRGLPAQTRDAEPGVLPEPRTVIRTDIEDADATSRCRVRSRTARRFGFRRSTTQTWNGSLPVGKGHIYERGQDAFFERQFSMDVQAARETFQVVKQLDELTEWS
jgi:hypothetical protein